ncbi:helix-turn-helix domain-containing protein [Nocardioides sp. J2M5]|uniref:helix-turn-helix domain-containing protein n=1 Tax=Nocardioides palaemonis TaxID=2829810 RepID=UPI001BA8744B|nr:helix-turn-helix domain-containing protein [Nocardioides palaemonis]MBS2938929.1 helix-turn-helix domain-containing protein [Nocardioides palaemonis]
METTASPSTGPLTSLEPLLSIEELAEYLQVPITTIRDWRTDGKGPCAIKVGGRVRYATSDVLAWLGSQRESEPGHGPSGG